MSAARPRSRAEKAIFDIASTNVTTLCSLMSMCSITSTSSSDFVGFIFSLPSFPARRRGVDKSLGSHLPDNAWDPSIAEVPDSGRLLSIQPCHIIGYPRFKWKLRGVSERAARVGQIRLGEVLVMGVRIIEVIRLKISLERAIQNKDELVKRSSLAAAEIVNSARAGIERANCSIHHILHINEIAALFAVFENARALAGAHLLRQMINHACGHAFVRFARAINIEVTQAYNDPIRILTREPRGEIIHDRFGKGVDVCGSSHG